MDKKSPLLLLLLSVFFILDLVNPSGYSLNLEFLFVGIIFAALNFPPWPAIFMVLVFGYFKDAFIQGRSVPAIIELPSLFLLVYYFNSRLSFAKNEKYRAGIKTVVASLAVLLHITLHSLVQDIWLSSFSLTFFFHSLLLLIAMDLFFHKRLRDSDYKYF